VKAAVVGLGMMGRNHARVWSDMPGVDLAGVVDPATAARDDALRGRTTRAFSDMAEMLDAVRPDVVSVATPTAHHEECVAQAAERGVHVLLEKPVAPDVVAAERIAAIAERAGITVMVGHIERFNPALLELRRRLEAEEIGALFQLQARRVGPFPSRIRDVGVVQDLATHDLDQTRFLLRDELDLVFAQTAQRVHTEHEDLVSMVGRSRGGVIVDIEVNWLSPRKVREVVALGAGGMFVADSLTQDLFLYENDYEEGAWRLLDTLRGVSEGNMTRFAIRRKEPLRAEIEAFVAAVQSGGAPPIPLADGIMALRLAEATLESARRGAPVTMEEPCASAS